MRLSLNNNMATVINAARLWPLANLASGQHALLSEVVGRPDQVQRLKELGFRRGVNLEMVRAGSPCIVRLQGHTMCIRGNDLLNVLVECEE